MTATTVDTSVLKQFEPLKKLNEKQLILLESKHEVRGYKKGHTILEAGSSDNIEYFLLKGSLKLTANDGKTLTIDADTKAAKNAIAHLQPRQYTVKALKPSVLLLIDWSVLAQFIREAPKGFAPDQGSEIAEFNTPAELILNSFKQDLANNNFTLPSLPDVALSINQRINWDDCSAKDVAKAINADPSMVVKLISAANSPLYRGMSNAKSCDEAVSRLGLVTTKRLLNIYALRELFKTQQPSIKQKMQELWAHCEEVAAISYVLAKFVPGITPDQAMLAGLIHDIGVIPVLMYADSHHHLFGDDAAFDGIVSELKADVGQFMLKKWNWSDELINVVVQADNWTYTSAGTQPDYADIIIIAQLHAAVGKPIQRQVPPLDSVPAFLKLKDAELTPQKSLQIISDAKADVDEARKLLNISS